MADRMWDDQQPSHCELSCMSACKIFLAAELLLCIKALYSRTAAWNQLNCRGPRPHSRMMHHEEVVSLTIQILLSIVSSHFCEGLSVKKENHAFGNSCANVPKNTRYLDLYSNQFATGYGYRGGQSQ